MEHERRRHRRYGKADLEVDVARPGVKGILSRIPAAQCLDFCLGGLRFVTDQPFQPGEPIILDLRVYELTVNEIHARVVSCLPRDDGRHATGVRFCFEEKQMQRPEISHALLHIEDRLRMAEEFPLNHSAGREH